MARELVGIENEATLSEMSVVFFGVISEFIILRGTHGRTISNNNYERAPALLSYEKEGCEVKTSIKHLTHHENHKNMFRTL